MKGDVSKFLVFILGLVLVISFIFAAHVVTTSAGGTSYSINEDISNFFNISINNTDVGQDANITYVQIYLLGNFIFLNGSEGTDTSSFFSNTSTVLTWVNTTDYVINGSALNYFWFNVTSTTPGTYNITIQTINSTGNSLYSNISVTVNDTTAPIITTYSPINNTNYYVNQSIGIHFSSSESGSSWYNYNETTNETYSGLVNVNYTTTGLKNITFYANDSAGNLNTTSIIINITSLPSTSFLINETTYNVSSTMNNLVVPYNSSLQNITLTNTSQQVSLDLSQLLSGGNVTLGTSSFRLLTQGTYNYTAVIANGTIISGGSGWDGLINLPTINSSSFTAPGSGTANVIVDMGGVSELNFSSSVKVIIGGMAGKNAAWSRGSITLTNITTICNSGNLTNTSAPTNIDAVTTRECYLNDGSDLVIWTYHFTSFAAYTPATAAATEEETPSSSGTAYSGWFTAKTLTDAEFKEGYTRELTIKQRIKFKVDGEGHEIGLISISNNKAKFNISSDSFEIELAVNETKKADVNKDNIYDLSVTLESLTSSKAKIKIISISEEVPEGERISEGQPQLGEGEEETTESGIGTLGIIVIIVLIIAALVGAGVGIKKYRR